MGTEMLLLDGGADGGNEMGTEMLLTGQSLHCGWRVSAPVRLRGVSPHDS
jgi:hypothetical protein